MRFRSAIFFALLFVITTPPQLVFACLWDYDSLAMERARFPEAHELIVGNFVRHSAVYYVWRIADRSKKPTEERTPLDYDDIAVAHDKLGSHDKAIETIHEKMERFPNEGQYESEANLGTFLIHNGQLEEGLVHINKAIEINPDAHFGREVYQKLWVEYLLEQATPSDIADETENRIHAVGFARYVFRARQPKSEEQLAEMQAAVKGVLGMMRFGHYDSPILLTALGDLLCVSDFNLSDDATMLASRAYLKASYETDDPAKAAQLRARAEIAIQNFHEKDFSEIEWGLKEEIKQGDLFFQQIAADETAWAESGRNLDEEFSKKYYQAPELEIDHLYSHVMNPNHQLIYALITFAFICTAIITPIVFVLRAHRGPRSSKA